jgi:hypothetical protein
MCVLSACSLGYISFFYQCFSHLINLSKNQLLNLLPSPLLLAVFSLIFFFFPLSFVSVFLLQLWLHAKFSHFPPSYWCTRPRCAHGHSHCSLLCCEARCTEWHLCRCRSLLPVKASVDGCPLYQEPFKSYSLCLVRLFTMCVVFW